MIKAATIKTLKLYGGVLVVVLPLSIAFSWPDNAPFTIEMAFRVLVVILKHPLTYLPLVLLFAVFLLEALLNRKPSAE